MMNRGQRCEARGIFFRKYETSLPDSNLLVIKNTDHSRVPMSHVFFDLENYTCRPKAGGE